MDRWSILDLPQEQEVEKITICPSWYTPEDIDVVNIEKVADDFQCRYQKHLKTYEFLVDNGST